MKKIIVTSVLIILAAPFIYHGISDLIRIATRIHVSNEFYIENIDGYKSKSLCNENQVFVGNIKKAFWNRDSLVVSGDKGCFLIEFGKTKYNDEMIKIDCSEIKSILHNKLVSKYIEKHN